MSYSKITYTYNGGDTVFSIPFEYIKKEFIYVYVNNELLTDDYYVIDSQSVIINKSIEIDSNVTIQRKTDLISLVNFTGRNNLKSFDLNLAFTQILHVMQEEHDTFVEIMPQTADGHWNAINKRLTNLAPAVNDSDAVRKDQIVSLAYDGMSYIETSVKQLLADKEEANGYAPLDDSSLIPQKYIPKSNYEPFCFNSGLVDVDGNPACVTINGNILTLLAGTVGTTADGTTYTIPSDVALDISTFTEGEHKLFYDVETHTLEEYSEILAQPSKPQDMSNGIIWLNTSVIPWASYIKNEINEIVTRKIIPLPANLVISSVSAGGGRS